MGGFGSPPRMRGKELAVGVIRQHGGITPAHAGKRPLSSACICRDWDHPRTCGEKRLMLLVFRAVTGSPPHMRGKGGQTMAKRTGLGITPAHAGKSYRSAFPGTMFRDHPRTCGEKPAVIVLENLMKRITPAHAGKSSREPAGPYLEQDHPRTCGEKPLRVVPRSGCSGITPAHAGKSQLWTATQDYL